MELTLEQRGDVRIVRVGEAKLTYPILPSFFAEVRQIADEGCQHLLIDLQAVSYIDSASIGCLMDIHRLMLERRGRVRVCGLQARVETMISMTGLHKIIELHRDEAGALAAFEAEEEAGDA